jgi:thioredoxin 1
MKPTLYFRTTVMVLLLGLSLTCSREEVRETAEHEPEPQVATGTTAVPTDTIVDRQTGEFIGSMLPRMVDLGRGTCIPCKMMEPILKEVTQEYDGRAIIEVIDLRDDAEAARRYGIRVIPTQIFFDTAGNEVWRHEGFLPKDAIVEKLAELGVQPIDR